MISCSKQKTLSCDPDVNTWAQRNVSKYENSSRDKIVSLPLIEQTAIYVGLSGQKKISLWHDKLDLVIVDNSLTKNQLIHFKKLIDYLKPEHFDTEKGREEFNVYGDLWQSEMLKIYNCSEETIFWIAHTWMTKDEYESARI